jgi:hypothetical protein
MPSSDDLLRKGAFACLFVLALFTGATSAREPARKAENVVVVTLDGFRWQELFTGADDSLLDLKSGGVRDLPGLKRRYARDSAASRREALMPFLWGTVAKQGQIFGNPARKARALSTNGLRFSYYPGKEERHRREDGSSPSGSGLGDEKNLPPSHRRRSWRTSGYQCPE